MLTPRILQFIPPTAQTLCNEPRSGALAREIRSLEAEVSAGETALRVLIEPTVEHAQKILHEGDAAALLIFSDIAGDHWRRQCRGWSLPVFHLPCDRQEEAMTMLREVLMLPENLQSLYYSAASRSVWQGPGFRSSADIVKALQTYFAYGVALINQQDRIVQEEGSLGNSSLGESLLSENISNAQGKRLQGESLDGFSSVWRLDGTAWRNFLQTEQTPSEIKGLTFGQTLHRHESDGPLVLLARLPEIEPAMYMLLQPRDDLSETEYFLAASAAAALALHLRLRQAANDVTLSYRDLILYDLLHNNLESERDFLEQAKRWPIPISACIQVMVAGGTHVYFTSLQQKSLITKIEGMAWKLGLDALPLAINNTVVTLVFLKDTEGSSKGEGETQRLAAALQQSDDNGNYDFYIGIGRQYPSVMDAYLSYNEAQLAMRMYVLAAKGQGFIHYDELGFIKLLSYIHNDLLLNFAKQHLGPLLAYDNENKMSLCQTLETYYANNGDIPQTARELFLHQNTLRNRLRRIESLLSVDPDNYYTMVDLLISLKIIKNFYEL